MVFLYCYKGTNITGERAVNPHKTQLNDALIESCHNCNGRLMLNQTDPYSCGSITGFGIEVLTF
jgi:hypothetical protein